MLELFDNEALQRSSDQTPVRTRDGHSRQSDTPRSETGAESEKMDNTRPIVNAMSVDVEDYYHVSAFADSIDRSEWNDMESRVSRNTDALLQIFSDANTCGTFFILGCVAEQYPSIVRKIASQGHEIACHGYSHQLIYRQSPQVFAEETRKAKALLEDISGLAVTGYRAASYSITRQSLWALDILADAGFKYDSSIFPVRHDRYGLPGAPTLPHIIELTSGQQLTEFPLSTLGLPGYRLPIAGGGYFRIFPYAVTKWAYRYLNKIDKVPVIFYLHPWEIDPEQPRIDASRLSRFRHYTNLSRTRSRLQRLLRDFEFSTVTNVLANADLDRSRALPADSLADAC